MSAPDGQLIETDKDRAGSLLPPVPDIRTYRQLGASEDPQLAALNQTLTNEAQAIGAQHLVGAFERAARSTLAGPSAPLAMRQDRERLTRDLNLKARELLTPRCVISLRERRAGSKWKPAWNAASAAWNCLSTPMTRLRRRSTPANTSSSSARPARARRRWRTPSARMPRQKALHRRHVTTATADWTTFDTIGGYAPGADQTLQFKPGSFLDAIGKGEWLVIDEINRAEIDKAFGELFTVLSGQRVDLPYTVGANRVRILPADTTERWPSRLDPDLRPAGRLRLRVHPQWRIIGTMNVYDKSSLFSMSLAFMRRFAFIDIGLPANYIALCGEWIGDDGRITSEADRTALQDSLRDLLDRGSVLMQRRRDEPSAAI